MYDKGLAADVNFCCTSMPVSTSAQSDMEESFAVDDDSGSAEVSIGDGSLGASSSSIIINNNLGGTSWGVSTSEPEAEAEAPKKKAKAKKRKKKVSKSRSRRW